MPEGQAVLLGNTPLEDNAIIGQCGTSDLRTLEVKISMLVGVAHARKEGERPPWWPSRRRWAVPSGAYGTIAALLTSCLTLARRAQTQTPKVHDSCAQ